MKTEHTYGVVNKCWLLLLDEFLGMFGVWEGGGGLGLAPACRLRIQARHLQGLESTLMPRLQTLCSGFLACLNLGFLICSLEREPPHTVGSGSHPGKCWEKQTLCKQKAVWQ